MLRKIGAHSTPTSRSYLKIISEAPLRWAPDTRNGPSKDALFRLIQGRLQIFPYLEPGPTAQGVMGLLLAGAIFSADDS